MSTATVGDGVQAFEAHRRALLGLAYRMLGSRTEADDVVQDAYLRWHASDRTVVEEPRRYLNTVVARLCLDRMNRHETYPGPWLPEPVVDEDFDAGSASDLAQDLSVALMLMLERLSPLERAAFLLHDVFDLSFAEIASALGRSEAACRQLASRAREHIQAERPRFPASPEEGQRLAAAFRTAADAGDVQALSQLLAQDAVLYSDGGGKRPAALNPIYGADKILRFLAGVTRKNLSLAALRLRPAIINGLAGFVMQEPDGSVTTMAIEHHDRRIVTIYFVLNPDKLQHVQF
jgi:RNA polymerase sigma-70 factor, ECF subfamily